MLKRRRVYSQLKLHRIKELIIQGYSYKGIAYQLALSVGTVSMYMTEIYKQLGVADCGDNYNKHALAIVKLLQENKEVTNE